MSEKFDAAIAAFGKIAKAKLANPSVTGQPEDQLRAPFEQLVYDLAELVGFSPGAVTPVGESSVRGPPVRAPKLLRSYESTQQRGRCDLETMTRSLHKTR
jgi:hypothetical protein